MVCVYYNLINFISCNLINFNSCILIHVIFCILIHVISNFFRWSVVEVWENHVLQAALLDEVLLLLLLLLGDDAPRDGVQQVEFCT